MEKISKHITYKEATKSDTAIRKGINNSPTPEIIERMQLVAEKVFEPIREHFRVPIFINSFYRSITLNHAIGGSSSSQHCTGEAIDMDTRDRYDGINNTDLFLYIKNNLEFDQLIWEYGTEIEPDWVHVSYKSENNRNSIIKAMRRDGKTIYVPYE